MMSGVRTLQCTCHSPFYLLILGTLQLLTQGSADLLLDLCSEFWDGTDLYPLTESDR